MPSDHTPGRRSPRRPFRLPPTRASAERDLDDELRLHLELRIAEYRARGMDADAARAEALRRFGDVDDARDYCRREDAARVRRGRRARWLEELGQDARLALRQLRRSRAFATAAVLTLAVGIAVSTACYAIVHAYLVRPLPYPDADRLASILAGPSYDPFPNAPSLRDVDWSVADSIFEATVSWDFDGFTLVGGERPEFVDGAWVTPGYFETLGLRPALGRPFAPDEFATTAPVALISDELWSRRFGRDPSIVGRTIRAHSTDRPRESELVTVVGVMPPRGWHISEFTDVVRPLPVGRMPYIGRLAPGTTLEDAEARLNAAVLAQLESPDPAWHMRLTSLQDDYTHRLRPTLVAMLAASLFMLLVAGASVAGALTARAAARRRELGVRAALGASRGRLARQLLAESLVLALLAAAAGVALAQVLLALFGARFGEHLGVPVPDLSGSVRAGPLVMAAAVATGMAIAVVCSLLPALLAARASSTRTLTGSERGDTGGAGAPGLRRALVATQIAVTMLLLVGAGLMGRTVLSLATEPLGFRAEGVLKANLMLPLGHFPDSAARVAGIDRVLDAVRAVPGVRSASAVGPHPFRGGPPGLPVTAEGSGDAATAGPLAVPVVISPDYHATLEMPLLQGRAFAASDAIGALPVAIVSAGLARRLWPDGEALGRRLRIGETGQWRTVVGVVPDTRKPLAAPQNPDVYIPFAQAPRAFVSLLVRADAGPSSLAAAIGSAVGRVSPVLALFEVEPLEDVIARDGARHRVLAALLGVFAAFALGLAVLALHSALSYVVAQRSRELAVRVAVGADRAAILRLVLGEGLATAAAGIAIGAAASLALGGVLGSQLHGVGPTDPATYVAIGALLAVTALGATLMPALRATRVDPASALRGE